MLSKAIVLLTGLLLSVLAYSQDANQPPTWSLKTLINSAELTGEWEISKIRVASGDLAAKRAAKDMVIRVTKGATFQIDVDLVSPDGARQNISGSPNLIYQAFRCLAVSPSGAATVTASGSAEFACKAGDFIPLTIMYRDPNTKVAAINMYLLKIQ